MSLSACATAANRRALYFPARPGGVWSDYETRRIAEAQTGINTNAYTTTTTTTTKTRGPVSAPVRSTVDVTAPPALPPGTVAPTGVATPDSALPQSPGVDTTAPTPPPP